ncbi:hypothetical protein BS78_09G106700 [Paspalum vaginatum]|nr:hypothetical protein BS78_09G106700 [Paspalum vaginatum]
MSTLWHIWKDRNDKIFNDKTWTAQQIHMHVRADLNCHPMNYSLQQRLSSIDNNFTKTIQNQNLTVTSRNCVCSVDASFLQQPIQAGPNIPGIGLFLKGRLQNVDFRLKVQAQGSDANSPIQAEAQALMVLSVLQLQRCTICSDNQDLITALNSNNPARNAPSWDLRPILAEMSNNINYSSCRFQKIGRSHNLMAHNLVKKAIQSLPGTCTLHCSNPLHEECPVIASLQSSELAV